MVKTGPEAGRRVELGSDVVIGRQDADLVLADPEVSRRHAVLRRSGDSVAIEDLDSTNGTFVNRERIRMPIALGPGDQVRVGRTTLEIEPDWRAAETLVSPTLRPDHVLSGPARPPADLVVEHPDKTSTQPLPSLKPETDVRPARSKWGWFGLSAVIVAVLWGAIAYTGRSDRPAEPDFAARANAACAAARSDGSVDLGRSPTRHGLDGARNVRLETLNAIRALERPEQEAALVGRFLSAFAETNASISRLERAIGTAKRKVAPVQRNLRGDVSDEREVAAKAGIGECGGLAFR